VPVSMEEADPRVSEVRGRGFGYSSLMRQRGRVFAIAQVKPDLQRGVFDRIKRKLMPEDVTPVVLFFASEEAAAVTAQSWL
jgi:hypothetical protein